jgi:DNA-binding transcriptional LysR family regulator
MVLSRQAVGILPDYLCRDLREDPSWRATVLPQQREVWLLIQQHLRRDPAARVAIEWLRHCFVHEA